MNSLYFLKLEHKHCVWCPNWKSWKAGDHVKWNGFGKDICKLITSTDMGTRNQLLKNQITNEMTSHLKEVTCIPHGRPSNDCTLDWSNYYIANVGGSAVEVITNDREERAAKLDMKRAKKDIHDRWKARM